MPVSEFENFATDLLVVHDGLSKDRLEYLFDRWSGGMDLPTEPCTPRELFAALARHECARVTHILTKESHPQSDYYCPWTPEWAIEDAA